MEQNRSVDIASGITKENTGHPYQEQILRIVNQAQEQFARSIQDPTVFTETHQMQERLTETHEDVAKYNDAREDIFQSFGIQNDAGHTYFEFADLKPQRVQQRVSRLFYLIIDIHSGEVFYGEGRIAHAHLVDPLIQLMQRKDIDVDRETFFSGLDQNPPKYIFVKGFLSANGFQDMVQARRALQTPLLDADGNVVNTPDNWFISAHNIRIENTHS